MNLSRSLAAVALLGVTAAGVSAAPIKTGRSMNLQRHVVDTSIIAPQYRHRTSPFHMIPPMPLSERARTSLVFDGDAVANAVLSAAVTSPPSGALANYYNTSTSEVQGLAQFGKGSLYVANTLFNNILVLNKKGKLTSTLTDTGQYPVNIALLPAGRRQPPTVYVANIFTTASSPGSVSVYAGGSTTPTSTLTASSFYQVIGVAVDKAGDVFVNNDTGFFSGGQVIEFPSGSSTGTVLSNIPVGIAGGLAVDPKTQDLVVVDQGTLTAYVYAAPYTGSAKASYVVPNSGSAVDVGFDKTSSNLYFGDVFGTIDVDSYPAGTYEGSYTGGTQPIGVAVRPNKTV